MPEMRRLDRKQLEFFSPDSLVDERSVVRVIDEFVENLDLAALGFKKTRVAVEGRPRYPVKSLLKLYIYGLQKDVRSSRKLEETCKLNLEAKWLMEGLEPDFRTISNFRKDNIGCMKKVFHEFNHKLIDTVEKGCLSIDGSKFEANNSKDNNFTANKLDDRLKWLNRHIEEYMRQLVEMDEKEEESGTFSREELEEKLKEARKRLERYQGYRDYMEKNGLSQLSLTDADAKLMKSKNGFEVAYNVQTAVDTKTHLIEDYQVTNQPTDHGLLESTARDEKARRGEIVEVVADKGYQCSKDIANCLENGIIANVIPQEGKSDCKIELPYEEAEVSEETLKSVESEDIKKCLRSGNIPEVYKDVIADIKVEEKRRVIKEETESEEAKSPYGTEEEMINRAKEGYFVRDPERNVVYCPAGETLRQKSVKKNGCVRYANKTACRCCPFRNQCFKGSSDFKEVDFNKDTLEKANRCWQSASGKALESNKKAESVKGKFRHEKYKVVSFKLKLDRLKMSLRKCVSEHPFGTIKRAMNGGYFLLRGMKKVDGETALLCLGYNIKRAMNLLGFKKMMEAMR